MPLDWFTAARSAVSLRISSLPQNRTYRRLLPFWVLHLLNTVLRTCIFTFCTAPPVLWFSFSAPFMVRFLLVLPSLPQVLLRLTPPALPHCLMVLVRMLRPPLLRSAARSA